MRLTVFGAGYVGLVTGAGLADLGHHVLIVDTDAKKIGALQQGAVPIHEPGLGDLLVRNVRAERLHFSTTASDFGSDIHMIAVGTPPREDGSADTRAVFAVGETIAALATLPGLVIVKSTVPVGTCAALQEVLNSTAKVPLEVVSNPEFLKEGNALADFFRPDRIVIGARTRAAVETVRQLYAPLQLSGECIVAGDTRSSELTKYAANTMLAMRVSFMNELSRLCHKTGADIHVVRKGIGSDSRIGKKFLYAGPSWGGSCFGKDVQALMALGREHDVPMRLAGATYQANEEQVDFVTRLVREALGSEPAGKKVALWGLAFKPETDDVRDAPSIKLTRALLAEGAYVEGHDPEAAKNFLFSVNPPDAVRGAVSITPREYEALDGADVLVLMTEWRCYLAPDFGEIAKWMRGKVVIDARNVWPAAAVEAVGLRYIGIGTRGANALR